MMKMFPCLASAVVIATAVSGCATEAKTLDANQIEQQYGIAGAHTGTIATPGGPMDGMIVPITLADGRTAQDTGATRNQVADATTLTNGSDNRLLDAFVDPAIGCSPFTARDLSSNGAPTTSLALNELQAAAHQAAPVALIPLNNPMTRVDGERSALKTNLYRAGVGQPPLGVGGDTGDPAAYCTKLADIGRQRLMADRDFFVQAPSPDAETANLYEFLTQRLNGSLQELGCADQ
jgi:hypothetical protein